VSATRRIGEGRDALVVHAVASYEGRARELVRGLKYDGRAEHARDLGHLLFRQLDRRWERHEIGLVVPNPTHVHRGVRHTELLVEEMRAADTERRWQFDDPANPCLVKVRPTATAYGRDNDGRRQVTDAVARALVVRRPDLIEGRQVLVIDDVATTGAQLQAVAQVLRTYGATEVQALVVADAGTPAPAVAPDGADPASGRALGCLERLRQQPHGVDGLSL